MKKIYLTLLVLIAFACSEDEPATVISALEGSLTFNGSTVEITKGFIVEEIDEEGGSNFTFYLTDGAAALSTIDSTQSFVVFLDLAGSIAEFQTGDYSFSSIARNIRSASVLSQGETYEATGGKLTLSGSNPTFTFDLGLGFNSINTDLEGVVTGTFPTQNN